MSLKTAVRSISSSSKTLARVLPSSTSAAASTSQIPPSGSPTTSPKSGPSKSSRIFGPRKTFLHSYYSHLLESNKVVLLFSHDNLSVSNLLKIRRAITKIPIPKSEHFSNTDDQGIKATLTISRSGLLKSLFKFPPTPKSSSSVTSRPSFKPYLDGPTALITSPSLSPNYISKLLTAINRTIKSIQKEVPPNTKPENVKQPKLNLVAGIMENNRLVGSKEIEEIGKLPELSTLQAQVVGLLEGQGRGLLGVLSQAGGGGLVRTLQGLEQGLKESSGEASQSSAGAGP